MSNKKYYWLKLQKDFFKRHDIRIIESMPNGKDYILFYLKLLVESVSHEGELRFSETIPYNEEMLSTITNTNVDIVRSALKVFTELQMIEIMADETIFMTEVEKMIGTSAQDEHTRESTRLRVAKHREKQKQIECEPLQKRYSNVTCNGELEIEKELEIEIEKDIYAFPQDFDFEKAWQFMIDKYPKKRNLASAKKIWLDDLMPVIAENKKHVATLMYKAELMFIDDYKKTNPDDTAFKFMPSLDKWLSEDCDYWVSQYEKENANE